MVSDEEDYEDEDNSNYSSELDDEMGSLQDFDTRSRFTDYSMSSSVITRNSQLTLLDETFEQVAYDALIWNLNAIVWNIFQ